MPSQSSSSSSTTPRGSTTRLHGLDAYVTEPSDGRPIAGVVVVISDAFGWLSANNRLLADRYADKGGHRVLVPDFLDNHPLPESTVPSLQGYLSGEGGLFYMAYCAVWVAIAWLPFLIHQTLLRGEGATASTIATFFSAVRVGPEASRGLPVFASGQSWGGRQAVLLAARRPALVDAVFVAHPSNLRVPAELRDVAVPVAFALATDDHALDAEGLERVVAKVNARGVKKEVRTYPAGHGFAVGRDLKGRDDGAEAAKAVDQAVAWFKEHSG